MSPVVSIVPMIRRLALLATVMICVIVTGCSDGYKDVVGRRAVRVGTTSDINPQDPATLRDGGDLRLAISSFPPNFNVLNIDGNTADVASIVTPTLPGAFITQADGSLKLNTDYFTAAELTSASPQVVTLTINPKAVWSDGTPITWEDIKSEVDACSGRDKRYLIASRAGFERVKSVTRGVDDRQAVVTFAQPYAEWRGMFAGGMQPRSMTENPDVFNKGQLDAPGPSAGPFIVSRIDHSAQRIVLTRNPRWWGRKPRLNSITFLVLDSSADHPRPAEQRDRCCRRGHARRYGHRRAHPGSRDPQRAGADLVSLHLQRRIGIHPVRREAAAGNLPRASTARRSSMSFSTA